MMRQALVLVLWLISAPAMAGPECEASYTATDFRAWVAEADEKLSDDDVIGHGTVYKTIQASAPCMVEPVPSAAWAEFLVGLAVIEHALGQEWQQPMTSALLADPLVTRDYGPDEIQSFAVEVPNEGPGKLSDGSFYIDGKRTKHPRQLPGVHIVQRNQGDGWDARVVRGGAFPAEWLPGVDAAPTAVTTDTTPEPASTPPPAPPNQQTTRVPGGTWATISVFGGYGTDDHAPSDTSSLSDSGFGGASVGATTSGEIVFEKAAELLETLFETDLDANGAEPGFFWDASLAHRLGDVSAVTPEAYAGLRLGFGPVSAWLGGGVSSVQVLETSTTAKTHLFGQPRIGVRTALPLGDWAVDLGGSGGWTPEGFHGNGTVGLRSIAGMGASFGIHGDYASAETGDERAAKMRVGLRGGVAFGGSRNK